MTHKHFPLDLTQVTESRLLSPERTAQIASEIVVRTKPLVTNGGTAVANAYTLTYPDGNAYLVQVNDYATLEYHQRTLLGALLTPAEWELLDQHALSAAAKRGEEAKFLSAVKHSDREWSGGVFWGDTYYASVEDALDMLVCDHDAEDSLPTFLWAAKPTQVITDLDVADVVESRIDSHGYEDMSTDDLDGVAELQAALDAFVATNEKVVSYWPDYQTAVVLSPETLAELQAQIVGEFS